mmetsp:Transcript_18972/g.47324  ORF Transcript_18972/g.47324 Transcript_18972/m.47324 type:complete len:514 (-) Transcript_18972:1369-2910(-)
MVAFSCCLSLVKMQRPGSDTRGCCLNMGGLRCVHRWHKRHISVLNQLNVEEQPDEMLPQRLNLLQQSCEHGLTMSQEAVLITRTVESAGLSAPHTSSVLFAVELLSRTVMQARGHNESDPCSPGPGQGLDRDDSVSVHEWLARVLSAKRVLLGAVRTLPSRAPAAPADDGANRTTYMCSMCGRPRSHLRSLGSCFKQGGKTCVQIARRRSFEEAFPSYAINESRPLVCPFCKRPSSGSKLLGTCYRRSPTEPQSRMCRAIAKQLSSNSATSGMFEGNQCNECGLPVKSFRARGCCSNPGGRHCLKRKRNPVNACGQCDEDAVCSYCKLPISYTKGRACCWRRPGDMSWRSRSCKIREHEILHQERTLDNGLCCYCDLPVSVSKRKGYCSSIGHAGKPGPVCARRCAKLNRVVESNSNSPEGHAAVHSFRRRVIQAALSQVNQPHLSPATEDALFHTATERNVFITGDPLVILQLTSLSDSPQTFLGGWEAVLGFGVLGCARQLRQRRARRLRR